MKTHAHQSQQGFVALIIILVFSAVMIVAVVSLSRSGIMAQYALLALEQKSMSETLALGCISASRTLLMNDRAYRARDIPVSVGDNSCTIAEISNAHTTIFIDASATVGRSTTNYHMELNPQTLTVTRLAELTD